MPNCFRLYPREGKTDEPATLQDVDAKLCQHFGKPVDPKLWYLGWYHCIGFLIACHGKALGSAELRQLVTDWYEEPDEREYRQDMLSVLDYLETHYTSDAWAEVGRRHA